jgi:hypothetical protein
VRSAVTASRPTRWRGRRQPAGEREAARSSGGAPAARGGGARQGLGGKASMCEWGEGGPMESVMGNKHTARGGTAGKTSVSGSPANYQRRDLDGWRSGLWLRAR